METKPFNVASDRGIGNLHQVKIRFGFRSLNTVQVATIQKDGEMVDHKSQMSKTQRFFKF